MTLTADTLLAILLGGLALVVLVAGAGAVVDRSVSLAQRYGLSDVLVATTVVAVGTSLPEIGSHVVASLGILSGTLDYRVASATVLGGNVGSSVTQQLLLFGVFLLGYGRYEPTRAVLRGSYLHMVLAAALLLLVAADGRISAFDGGVLLVAYALSVVDGVRLRRREPPVPVLDGASQHVARDVGVLLAGLVAVLGGAYVVLSVVQAVVDDLALGGSMVGVVTLGLASALPELSTVAEALRRRAPNVAVGALLGSNVVNPLLAVGLGGVLSTYHVPPVVVLWDLPFKLLVAVAFLAYWLAARDRTLRRRDGLYLVASYFAFVSGRLLLFAAQ